MIRFNITFYFNDDERRHMKQLIGFIEKILFEPLLIAHVYVAGNKYFKAKQCTNKFLYLQLTLYFY